MVIVAIKRKLRRNFRSTGTNFHSSLSLSLSLSKKACAYFKTRCNSREEAAKKQDIARAWE